MNTQISTNDGAQDASVFASKDLLAGVYFCVTDPHNNIVHTTISLTREGAINEWLEQDHAVHVICNAGRAMRSQKPLCTPSWEHCEAEGYKCLRFKLEAINAN